MSATGLCWNRNWPAIECVQHNGQLRLAWHALLCPVQSTVHCPPACLPMVAQLFPFDWAKKCVCAWNVPSSFICCSSSSHFSALDTLFGVPGQRRRALCGHHSRLGCVYCAICLSAFAFMDNDDHYAMSMSMRMLMLLMMMLLAGKLEAGELNVWVTKWALRTLSLKSTTPKFTYTLSYSLFFILSQWGSSQCTFYWHFTVLINI